MTGGRPSGLPPFFVYNKIMNEKNAADLDEERKAGLPARLRSIWEAAELEAMQPSYNGPRLQADDWGVLDIVEAAVCDGFKDRYPTLPSLMCERPAGAGTLHPGIGKCADHKGKQTSETRKAAVLMAIAYADEMNLTPWEALLSQCRLLANQVAWLRVRVHEVEQSCGPAGLRPGGEGWDWVAMLEARGERLAKVAKMCLDAGIQQQLVLGIQSEADNMMKAAVAGMDAAGLEPAQREALLDVMSSTLLQLTSGEGGQQ